MTMITQIRVTDADDLEGSIYPLKEPIPFLPPMSITPRFERPMELWKGAHLHFETDNGDNLLTVEADNVFTGLRPRPERLVNMRIEMNMETSRQ